MLASVVFSPSLTHSSYFLFVSPLFVDLLFVSVFLSNNILLYGSLFASVPLLFSFLFFSMFYLSVWLFLLCDLSDPGNRILVSCFCPFFSFSPPLPIQTWSTDNKKAYYKYKYNHGGSEIMSYREHWFYYFPLGLFSFPPPPALPLHPFLSCFECLGLLGWLHGYWTRDPPHTQTRSHLPGALPPFPLKASFTDHEHTLPQNDSQLKFRLKRR